MKMAYRKRWEAEIAEMQRVLAGFGMREECKWGKPTYTVDGKNVAILQGFKEYFALGFFQGALLKDPKKLLVQLGQTQAGRVMKFTGVQQIVAQAATIKAYVREAIAVEKAGLRVEKKKTEDFPLPEELNAKFRMEPRFKKAFDALTPDGNEAICITSPRRSSRRREKLELRRPWRRSLPGEGFWSGRKDSGTLLPLDGPGRLGGDVVDHAIDAADLADDSAGDGAQHVVGQRSPVGGHAVFALDRADAAGVGVGRWSPITPTVLTGSRTAKDCQTLR